MVSLRSLSFTLRTRREVLRRERVVRSTSQGSCRALINVPIHCISYIAPNFEVSTSNPLETQLLGGSALLALGSESLMQAAFSYKTTLRSLRNPPTLRRRGRIGAGLAALCGSSSLLLTGCLIIDVGKFR